MKQKILICFVFALVLSGCGKVSPTNQSASNLTNSTQFSSKLSLKELVAKGESLKCTINETDNAKKQEMVYYVDGKSQKMRADIKMDVGESGVPKIVNSSMIMDKQTVYTWSSDQPGMGMKFTLDLGTTQNEAQANKSLDVNSQMNFNCEKWNTNNSLFDLPTDIKFSDFSETMKSLQQTVPGVSDMCKVCDSLPQGKADCQKAYCK